MVGPPKKHFLTLILFVSFFALFLLTYYYHSSSNFSSSQNTHNKNLIPQTTPTFTLLIKVLAFNRLSSLSRCLRSLAAADYSSSAAEAVHLHIYIDHFAAANDSSAELDKKLEDSDGILEFVDGFDWKFGEKMVFYRTANVGLQAQWLEAWWPSSDNEFAFVVEDDLEVSPLFYKFVRAVIVNYYYNVSNFSPFVYGVSLQRPRFVPGKHGNKIRLDSGTKLFLYQLVGTWGQILFPKPWKEFRLWYDEHKAKGIKPLLDGMVTTGWYKRLGERIWTPWFIKFIHSSGYFNIYTNFQHERALSVSHRDPGVNYGKTAGPDSQLLDESSIDFKFLEMPPLSNLKWYDFCFREVHPGSVVRSLDELGSVLPSVQKQGTILLVSILGASDSITRNLLCHFERLNIGNYIFLGPHSDFLFDLARRGHPVIDADQLLNNIRAQKLIRFQDSSAKLMKDVLVKALVIKKCLEYSYNYWIVDANLLFVGNVPFLDFIHPSDADFQAGKHLEFLFVRSSPSAQKIWTDDFLNKVTATVGQVASTRERKSFVYIVAKLLEQNGVRIRWVDDTSFAMNIGAGSVNKSSLEAGKKIVYWSMEMSLDLIRKGLEELSLWAVDGESSCLAVICHQS